VKKWPIPKADTLIFLGLLLLGSIGFWYFEKLLAFRILYLILFAIILIWQLLLPSSFAGIYLSYFVTFWVLINLYFTVNVPIGSQLFFVFALILNGVHLYFLRSYQNFWPNALLFILIFSEIYMALSFWPADPISKAMILLLLFYSFWEAVELNQNRSFNLIWQPLVVSGILFFLTVATTSWYTF
jgi:hypothetical protein